jgi:coproporphyrinogen III oxidase-like Fe-S oxidoreductase
VRNNSVYQRSLAMPSGEVWFELEDLNDQEWFHEQVLTQLRRAEGLPRAAAQGRDLDRAWSKWVGQGLMLADESGWRLCGEGWLWADAIASDAFGLEP